MKIVVIGGTGHIGTYLVPRLVTLGHEVVCVTRGAKAPYLPHASWSQVEQIVMDREALDAQGQFGPRIRDLRPDVVMDLVCFREESAQQLVSALRGQVQMLIHCGTIWVHGPSVEVPTTEAQPRRPFGEYGIQKAAIETYLLKEARANGFPATILHPGHIVGQGWIPLNPAGNFNPEVYRKLSRGEEILIPNLGLETVHHVHADDVAQAFVQAMHHWSAAVGESFHVVSPAALTLRGFAEAVAAWFGQPARLKYVPLAEMRGLAPEEDAAATWDHIAHSPNCSIEKARRLLGYQPRYTSLQAIFESLDFMIQRDMLR